MKYKILFLVIILSQITNAQTGFLDLSFGDQGIAKTPIGGTLSMCLDQNNNILVGGYARYLSDTGYSIRRHLADGSLDSSFGKEGFSIISDGIFKDGDIRAIAVQPDGKIITGGNSGGIILLARFKENGNLDSSFGVYGTSVAEFDKYTTIYALQIQVDGKYVLAGDNSDINMNRDIIVLRFNQDGSLDNSFGKNGEVIISQLNAISAQAVVLQPDGKIIIGGRSNEGINEFFVARLNTDGSLDHSFSGDGIVVTSVDENAEYINSLALQQDGKIVAAGISGKGKDILKEVMTIVRYSTDGILDTGFGKNGIVTVRFSDEAASEANAILIQEDGKIVGVGRTANQFEHYSNAALTRLKTNGSIDSSFGINGKQITDIGGSDVAFTAIFQQDQKIVISDFAYFDAQNYYCALARYNNDAVMPLHFTYFNAAPTNNGGISLSWQTAQENNNAYFAVERNADSSRIGRDGNDVGGGDELTRINSKGNSSQAQAYSYTDNTPLQGTNFYRLKQVDKDGKFSYSQVVSATIQNGLTVVLYPNPVKDVLNIKGLDAGMIYELSVMSAKGSVVAQTSMNNTSSYKWNLKSLGKGVYYLSVISSYKKTIVKFVKE